MLCSDMFYILVATGFVGFEEIELNVSENDTLLMSCLSFTSNYDLPEDALVSIISEDDTAMSVFNILGTGRRRILSTIANNATYSDSMGDRDAKLSRFIKNTCIDKPSKFIIITNEPTYSHEHAQMKTA